MADEPDKAPVKFSSNAQKAKADTIRGFKDEITKKVIERWAQLHGEDHLKLTRENVEQEVYNLTHPTDIDPTTGQPPKYNYKFGNDTPIPSEATMEQFGNAAARSIDNGTEVMGMSWLNTIIVAIQALVDWLSGGSESFAASFAKITTQNITHEFDKEAGKLEQDPEHKKFMDANNIKSLGREQIASGVRREAGLETGAAAEPFNIDKAIAAAPNPFPEIKAAAVKGATPEATINNAINAAIDGTKATYDKDLKALDPEAKKTFDNLEAKLREQAKAVTASIQKKEPGAPATREQYADAVIKKTLESMDPEKRRNFGISDDLMNQPVSKIIETLKAGGDKQKVGAGLMLGTLRTNLASSYSAMREDLGVKVSDADRQAEDKKGKQEKLADAQDKVKTIGDTLSSTIRGSLADGIKETVAIKVWSKSFTNGGGNAKTGEYIKASYSKQADGTYTKNEGTRAPTRDEKVNGIERNYDYAIDQGLVLNREQLDLVTKTAGEVTREYIDSLAKEGKPLPDRFVAGAQLEKKILARLRDKVNPPHNANGKTIDELGAYTVAQINGYRNGWTGSGADTFADIAKGFGDAVRENKTSLDETGTKAVEGAYSQLAKAREQLAAANKEVAKATAELNPSAAPKMPSSNVRNPASTKTASPTVAPAQTDRAEGRAP